jgi:putative transposase
MARKLRLEYPGAIYHVLNRGNYRGWVFKEEGARHAFEECLFQACVKCGWLLHAYVLMGNHFHLAVETPEGNLTVGMQWLQSTYANRFNRLRKSSGHLFQGRFKALVVEKGESLGRLCHYIHLNPARAKIVNIETLKDYRYGSYWYLNNRKQRPDFLRLGSALEWAGQLADTPAGLKAYEAYLKWQLEDGPAGKGKAYESLSKGWAIGSKEFKQALIDDHKLEAISRAWESTGARELARLKWQRELEVLLEEIGEKERQNHRKAAPWKVAIAVEMKRRLPVSNGWLAEQLQMGSGIYVSKHVGLARHLAHPSRKWLKQLEKVKGKA